MIPGSSVTGNYDDSTVHICYDSSIYDFLDLMNQERKVV